MRILPTPALFELSSGRHGGRFHQLSAPGALVHARALFERLRREFGTSEVFIDLDGIEIGGDFVALLEEQLQDCRIMLALIDPAWATATDKTGKRRLDKESDFVRIEIATALRRGVHVAPILLDGADMPEASSLPDDLQPLTRRQALGSTSDASTGRWPGLWGSSVESLMVVPLFARPQRGSRPLLRRRWHRPSTRLCLHRTGSSRRPERHASGDTGPLPSDVHESRWRPSMASGIGAVAVLALILVVMLLLRLGSVTSFDSSADPEPAAPSSAAAESTDPNPAPAQTASPTTSNQTAERQVANEPVGRKDSGPTATAAGLPSLAAVFSSSEQDHEAMLSQLRAAHIEIASESATPAASSFTSGPTVMYDFADDEVAARWLAAMLTKQTQRRFAVLKRPRGPGPTFVRGKVVVYNF